MGDSHSRRYAAAGVDLRAANQTVQRYETLLEQTSRPGVLPTGHGFGGLFALRDAGVGLHDPVLVTGADGVGTKLKLAMELNRHDTVGIDCVAMCANDIAARGAKPLFFVDYLASGKLNPNQAETVVSGISHACREVGCALLGGETAEMPGFFPAGEYDLAGFCVGLVERSELLGPSRVHIGDVIVGLNSSGFHSNGFSLIRQVVADARLSLHAHHGLDLPLGLALLEPTRLYSQAVSGLPGLKSAAHITGGAFYKNLPRAIPADLGVHIDLTRWTVPPVFELILEAGKIPRDEAFHVFNMGIGMALFVHPDAATACIPWLAERGYEARVIGQVVDVPGVHLT